MCKLSIGTDISWKFSICETEILSVVKAVHDTEATLEADQPSTELQRARSLCRGVAKFAEYCATSSPKVSSFMVPDTTDASGHRAALLSYRETEVSVLRQTIHWCQNYADDQNMPRTKSLLAEALLNSKTGIAFCAKATLYLTEVAHVDGLENAMNIVEKLCQCMRAKPMADIDPGLADGHELEAFIGQLVLPFEDAVKEFWISLAETEKICKRVKACVKRLDAAVEQDFSFSNNNGLHGPSTQLSRLCLRCIVP